MDLRVQQRIDHHTPQVRNGLLMLRAYARANQQHNRQTKQIRKCNSSRKTAIYRSNLDRRRPTKAIDHCSNFRRKPTGGTASDMRFNSCTRLVMLGLTRGNFSRIAPRIVDAEHLSSIGKKCVDIAQSRR